MPHIVLVRGLPGSGKSTLARSMEGYFHVEADMFFTDAITGEYNFRPEWLSAAHDSCQRLCRDAINRGENVVVSNTFTRAWEMKPYFDMGYEVRVIECKGRWDNIHGVPVEAIERMAERWEPVELVDYI